MDEFGKAAGESDPRFLTFKTAGRLYALPATSVSEVVRLPPIARVPQAPKSLMGLANLRGSVLPVASVSALLGRDEAIATHASRLIVLEGTSAVALAVDEVSSLVRISAEKIRTAETDVAAEAGEHLRGAFESHSNIIKVLDIPELLRRAFADGATNRERTATKISAKASEAIAPEAVRQRLVTFEVGGQEYALPLDSVREIVATPENPTSVPGSDDAVRGIMPYRNALLPLLSLRRLLGLPSAITTREYAVIVAVGGVLIGFVADRMRAVLSVDPDRLEPAPQVLAARAGGETQIKEIYRAGHDRLVSILAPERLFREDVMQKLLQGDGAMKVNSGDSSRSSDAEELRFLIFRLDEDEFALPIEAVDEVARVPDQITRLPKTPKFLEGVVNLRGEVLPVVDQRRRFDIRPATVTTGRRLIVVRTERHRAGLIVDSVSEVLRCPPGQIKPSPDLTGDALGLVHSVINLEASGRIVLLLDPSELLTRTERNLLDSFGKETISKESRQTKS
jgi:purine-binding chemotaxis protein CheW